MCVLIWEGLLLVLLTDVSTYNLSGSHQSQANSASSSYGIHFSGQFMSHYVIGYLTQTPGPKYNRLLSQSHCSISIVLNGIRILWTIFGLKYLLNIIVQCTCKHKIC